MWTETIEIVVVAALRSTDTPVTVHWAQITVLFQQLEPVAADWGADLLERVWLHASAPLAFPSRGNLAIAEASIFVVNNCPVGALLDSYLGSLVLEVYGPCSGVREHGVKNFDLRKLPGRSSWNFGRRSNKRFIAQWLYLVLSRRY